MDKGVCRLRFDPDLNVMSESLEFDLLSGEHVAKIVAGQGHFLALTSLRRVFAWGDNRYGQLGFGYTSVMSVQKPTVVPALDGLVTTHIECGSWHSAVVADGVLYTFGWSHKGQLGFGNAEGIDFSIPNCVSMPQDWDVLDVSCGFEHTAVILDNGSLKQNIYGCGSSMSFFMLQRTVSYNANLDLFGQLDNSSSTNRELTYQNYIEHGPESTLFCEFNFQQMKMLIGLSDKIVKIRCGPWTTILDVDNCELNDYTLRNANENR